VLPPLPGELGWTIVYTGVGAFLSVQGALLPGDFNSNGVVDAADYVLWRGGGPLANDTTPGVQPGDYTVWRSGFGRTVGSGADSADELLSAAVPEPATLVIVSAAILLATVRRDRKSCRSGFSLTTLQHWLRQAKA
jgi:hypothetical protein